MSYSVKEIYYTLQGEGLHSGRAAVFCRFSGCNLWNGREKGRCKAICKFCDTDFVGTDGPNGGKFESAEDLAKELRSHFPEAKGMISRPLVVCTGGEPLLQLDEALVDALHMEGFEVAIETNGTLLPPIDIDWICVSPKAGAPLELTYGHELKFVYPQEGLEPKDLEKYDFRYFFIQPMDGPYVKENTEKAIEYCLANPCWRLSLQTHKTLGIP